MYGHGCMHNLDLYVAGLSETHINGGMLGETFYEICVDQFSRLRDGDRFWYQNDPFFDNDNGSGSSRYNIQILKILHYHRLLEIILILLILLMMFLQSKVKEFKIRTKKRKEF